MMKNDTVVIQHHPALATSLVKPPMSRTLVHRTNKEFDKCAELLRNILSVQESRRDSKSSTMREVNRRKQQQSSVNTRQNSKATVTKSTFVRTNLNGSPETGERRSSYSPNKNFHATTEEPSLLKNRLSPNRSRKHIARSPSPTQTAHQRLTSPSKNKKSPPSPSYHRTRTEEELVRSSSCGDLPSSKSSFMHKEKTRFILDQFITHLTRIRTLSKQIRARNSNSVKECYHLWDELENSLLSALSYAKDDIQLQLSLAPIRSEIIELRKQLQTTNVHLHEHDLTRRTDEQYVHLQKKFDSNQIQCTQLLLHNEELKTKCYLLQDKLDHLQRNNIRLIQRLTQQDLRSISQHTEWTSTDNRKQILFLKNKLYDVYDDLATVFNRNHTLQISIGEQKQQLLLYKQQFNDLKQSTQQLLRDLDNRSLEDKVKRFLNNILLDQNQYGILTSPSNKTQTKPAPSAVDSPSFLFESPHKPATAPTTSRLRASPITATSKLRPKSLFVTPTILNDSKALSKFQDNITYSSSSTIDDADSTLTSSSSTSLYYQQRKRTTLYNSLPSLAVPTTINITKTGNQQIYNNESSPEFDQISDLTSKMFSSGDDEDVPIGDIDISTSSSSGIPSDAERLKHM